MGGRAASQIPCRLMQKAPSGRRKGDESGVGDGNAFEKGTGVKQMLNPLMILLIEGSHMFQNLETVRN